MRQDPNKTNPTPQPPADASTQPAMSELSAESSAYGVLVGKSAGPKIVCMASSDCFIDAGAFKAWDQGIQAHYLTTPGDTLVLRPPRPQGGPERTDAEIGKILLTGMDVNAALWRDQTGIPIPDSSQCKPAMVPVNQSMRDTLKAEWSSNSEHMRVLLSAAREDVIADLEITDPKITQVAKTVGILDSKVQAIELCNKLGIQTPFSIGLDSDKPDEFGALTLRDDLRYIIKPDGGAAGLGILHNEQKGYTSEEVVAIAQQHISSGQLSGLFQIQELVEGAPVGAIARFDGDGNFEVKSIHQAIEKDKRFKGSLWQPQFAQTHYAQVHSMFEKIAQCEELTPLGPIGMDMILTNDGRLLVLEFNPRTTGASPLALILDNEPVIKKHRGEQFSIQSIEIDIDIMINSDLIATKALEQVVKDSCELFVRLHPEQAGMEPMILFQGITQDFATKAVFVNDVEGRLKQIFKSKLLQTPE